MPTFTSSSFSLTFLRFSVEDHLYHFVMFAIWRVHCFPRCWFQVLLSTWGIPIVEYLDDPATSRAISSDLGKMISNFWCGSVCPVPTQEDATQYSVGLRLQSSVPGSSWIHTWTLEWWFSSWMRETCKSLECSVEGCQPVKLRCSGGPVGLRNVLYVSHQGETRSLTAHLKG